MNSKSKEMLERDSEFGRGIKIPKYKDNKKKTLNNTTLDAMNNKNNLQTSVLTDHLTLSVKDTGSFLNTMVI
jgi:hypothetical protein